MNDIGPTLTTTGLIATVVSVLFAIAAFYVSHRRRTQAGGHTTVHTGPSAGTITPSQQSRKDRAHVPMSEGVQSTQTAAREPSPPKKPALVMTTPSPATGAGTFNRLSTEGVEEEMPKRADNEKYEWE